MFKATEDERKIRETNLPIDMEINLSSCTSSEHYFSLSPGIVMGLTRN